MRSGRRKCDPASMATPPPAAACESRHGSVPWKNGPTGGVHDHARAVTSSPIAPSSSSRLARTTPGQYCAFSASMKTVPASRAAARMRSLASSVVAIGFSSSTWRRARKASSASGSCR